MTANPLQLIVEELGQHFPQFSKNNVSKVLVEIQSEAVAEVFAALLKVHMN